MARRPLRSERALPRASDCFLRRGRPKLSASSVRLIGGIEPRTSPLAYSSRARPSARRPDSDVSRRACSLPPPFVQRSRSKCAPPVSMGWTRKSWQYCMCWLGCGCNIEMCARADVSTMFAQHHCIKVRNSSKPTTPDEHNQSATCDLCAVRAALLHTCAGHRRNQYAPISRIFSCSSHPRDDDRAVYCSFQKQTPSTIEGSTYSYMCPVCQRAHFHLGDDILPVPAE